jgi:hypothetical protein
MNDGYDISYNFIKYHRPTYYEDCAKKVNQELHDAKTTISRYGFIFDKKTVPSGVLQFVFRSSN